MNWLTLYRQALSPDSDNPYVSAPTRILGRDWHPPQSLADQSPETRANMLDALRRGALVAQPGTVVWRQDTAQFQPSDARAPMRPLSFVTLPGPCVAWIDAAGQVVHCDRAPSDTAEGPSRVHREAYNATLLRALGLRTDDLAIARRGDVPRRVVMERRREHGQMATLALVFALVFGVLAALPTRRQRFRNEMFRMFVAPMIVVGGIAVAFDALQTRKRLAAEVRGQRLRVLDRPLRFRAASGRSGLLTLALYEGESLRDPMVYDVPATAQTLPGAVHRFYCLPTTGEVVAAELAPGPIRYA